MKVASNGDGASRWTREETFDCAATCRVQGTTQLDPDARASRNCALDDFPRHRWRGDELVQIHMGRPPAYDREGQDSDWNRPHEDMDEGCPGSWYRNEFVRSLHPYRRRGDGNGGRVPNPRLDRCDDRLILEWIAELEAHEDAAQGDFLDATLRG